MSVAIAGCPHVGAGLVDGGGIVEDVRDQTKAPRPGNSIEPTAVTGGWKRKVAGRWFVWRAGCSLVELGH